MTPAEVVITGIGVACPIGMGAEAFWAALQAGNSGVRSLQAFDASGLPVRIAAEVLEFDAAQYVRPRKSLKFMARAAQLAFAASELCLRQSRFDPAATNPDRFGVILGVDPTLTPLVDCAPAYRQACQRNSFDFPLWSQKVMETYPLVMLRNLPNMISAQLSIAHNARSINNTLYAGDISGMLALGEAARVIQRGAADIMLSGGASSRMHPADWVRFCLFEQMSQQNDCPSTACRPFDALRTGMVRGEGAAIFLLENRAHALARGAPLLGEVLGFASTSEPRRLDPGAGLRQAMVTALKDARISPSQIGHVNANGVGTHADAIEARTLHALLGRTPVTALKSYFGNLGAAGGPMELAASVMGLQHQLVPRTINYSHPDEACPLDVIGSPKFRPASSLILAVNRTNCGQSTAMVVAGSNR